MGVQSLNLLTNPTMSEDGFIWAGFLGGISDALGLGDGGNRDNIRSGVDSVPSNEKIKDIGADDNIVLSKCISSLKREPPHHGFDGEIEPY